LKDSSTVDSEIELRKRKLKKRVDRKLKLTRVHLLKDSSDESIDDGDTLKKLNRDTNIKRKLRKSKLKLNDGSTNDSFDSNQDKFKKLKRGSSQRIK